MLNVSRINQATVIGGGTAGWFSALTLRGMFAKNVRIVVIESPKIGIVGVGEGGLLNLIQTLNRLDIPVDEFVRETGAAYKLGFAYEGWRDGSENDRFYHMFANVTIEELQAFEYGLYPLLSALTHHGVEVHQLLAGFPVVAAQGSQEDARKMLATPDCGISASYHFDSRRITNYLKRIALERGVEVRQTEVTDVLLDEKGHATAVQTVDGPIPTDLVIDASGLARLVVGKKLNSEWVSFSDYLLLDRAIPFHMPHPKPNPYLVTRAIAMNAGWMWQIPLVERVGAGYVFSSRHLDEDAARREASRRVGFDIAPERTLHFHPGHFRKVWLGNVMAIGLASGFVEPLEATSIGQTLEQLRNFRTVVLESGGIVADTVIDAFNDSNARYWSSIRDFLRMHYDCTRRDTPFWQDIAKTPLPPSYRALKECMQHRLPRQVDIEPYFMGRWSQIFHIANWIMVAVPLGLISREGALRELSQLPAESREAVARYLARRWPQLVKPRRPSA